jgi:hypothetical protein
MCPIEGAIKMLFHPRHGGVTVINSVPSTNVKTSNLRMWFIGIASICKNLIKDVLHVIGKMAIETITPTLLRTLLNGGNVVDKGRKLIDTQS